MKHTDGGGWNIVGGQLKPNYSVSTITSPLIVDRGHISAISKGKIFFEKKKGFFISLCSHTTHVPSVDLFQKMAKASENTSKDLARKKKTIACTYIT